MKAKQTAHKISIHSFIHFLANKRYYKNNKNKKENLQCTRK